MNQSFGGAFLIKIALIFLSIYIFVMGFAINYARVFSMKNKIITLIEEYEGYNTDSNSEFGIKLQAEANKLNYVGAAQASDSDIRSILSNMGIDSGDCLNQSNWKVYCIVPHLASDGVSSYYRVVTYIHFEIPVITNMAVGNIPVSGETRNLYDF